LGDAQLAVTGQLSLAGKVDLVGDVDAKLDPCTRRWADSVLIPLDNKAEADALPAVGRGRRVHYAAVRDMQVGEPGLDSSPANIVLI
jgi:ATP-dependent Lon protease